MEYIQELQFLVGDVELNKEELIVLNSFTDEIVNLKPETNTDYSRDKDLYNAFSKIHQHNLLIQYIKLIVDKRSKASMKDFSELMDKKQEL